MAEVNDALGHILTDRGAKYGPFGGHAGLAQRIKDLLRHDNGWVRLSSTQRESMEMIAHKIARIVNGDPTYADSWVDIAGYAQLIVKELNDGQNG